MVDEGGEARSICREEARRARPEQNASISIRVLTPADSYERHTDLFCFSVSRNDEIRVMRQP
jgi:hypothetical protein